MSAQIEISVPGTCGASLAAQVGKLLRRELKNEVLGGREIAGELKEQRKWQKRYGCANEGRGYVGHTMSEDEKNIRMLEAQIPAHSGVAFNQARDRVLASGQSVLQAENGVLYEVYPDGRKRQVKTVEQPTTVVTGTKIAIR